MENLNEFEKAYLEALSQTYPVIKEHIEYLRVKERTKTGVGLYVDFIYLDTTPVSISFIAINDPNRKGNGMAPLEKDVYIEGLKLPLIDMLNFENGRIYFLELVTLDEPWDGSTDKFRIA